MRVRATIVIGTVVAVILILLFVTDSLPVSPPGSKVDVQGFNLVTDYTPGSNPGGCFPPVNQVVPGSFTVDPGALIRENITLTDVVTNVQCTLDSVSITTPGFQLVSYSPPLPYVLANGTSISLRLLIRTPAAGFQGLVTVQVGGSARLLGNASATS